MAILRNALVHKSQVLYPSFSESIRYDHKQQFTYIVIVPAAYAEKGNLKLTAPPVARRREENKSF